MQPLTLKIEATVSYETFVVMYQPTRGHMLEDNNLEWEKTPGKRKRKLEIIKVSVK
jgi:hypothetical protein